MKILPQSLLLLTALLLSSCIFKEPVFRQGFTPAPKSWPGVWTTDGTDPRTGEYALLAPLNDGSYLLTQPANSAGAFYYQCTHLRIRGRHLLQLQVLASFKGGLPKGGVGSWTLVWVTPLLDGRLSVRPLTSEGKTYAECRALLTSSGSDWNKLFGKPTIYRKLP